LRQVGLRALRDREIWRIEPDWRLTGELSISIDGRYAAVIEARETSHRLRVVETVKGKNWVVAEEKSRLSRPQLRPRRDQVLYSQPEGARLWLVNLDGKQKQAVRPRQASEEISPEYWTWDGKLLEYVHYADRKSTVRTYNPDTREESTLARCTQFWGSMGNADNSAIVGESRSKAGPNIYVLFPLTDREITVCEHASSRSSPEVEPRPAFSPDSQWIYFTSDREGVPAVYRAGVADWVEKT
jgi:oligogalacturonide lyase